MEWSGVGIDAVIKCIAYDVGGGMYFNAVPNVFMIKKTKIMHFQKELFIKDVKFSLNFEIIIL